MNTQETAEAAENDIMLPTPQELEIIQSRLNKMFAPHAQNSVMMLIHKTACEFAAKGKLHG